MPERGEVEVKVFQHEKQLRTAGGLTVTDITDEVQRAVRDSGIQENTVLALLVNDTDTRRRTLDHLDRNPHFRMLR